MTRWRVAVSGEGEILGIRKIPLSLSLSNQQGRWQWFTVPNPHYTPLGEDYALYVHGVDELGAYTEAQAALESQKPKFVVFNKEEQTND